ncbi:DegV family protein [Siminovitchia sp. 179-K 8D1 HS]|uniref:DegV family protein n=1 Tax=Siminovitchia sp. 179-K 8D1 HS TaxID=3142385 RepID=UPI0039A1A197
MKPVKIITDSSCDLSREEAKKLGVNIVPLTISIGEQSYEDGVDITPGAFIEEMKRAAMLPKSSQPSSGEFASIYEELSKDGSELLSIHLSGKLSGTVATAKMAADSANAKVTVIDSSFISKALAFQVREAAMMAKNAFSSKEIVEKINLVRKNTRLFVVVDTLENLVKGGRIGKGRALIGSLLNIKPIAVLEEGEYSPVGKVRSHSQAISFIMSRFVEDIKGKTLKYAGIAHADGLKFAEKLKHQIEQTTGFQSVEINITSPVISTHTGRGAIGFSYYAE